MVSIKTATYLDGYRIALVFANGEVGTVNLTDVIREFPAAAALRTRLFSRPSHWMNGHPGMAERF